MADKENFSRFAMKTGASEAWDEGTSGTGDKNRLFKAFMKDGAPPLKSALSEMRPKTPVLQPRGPKAVATVKHASTASTMRQTSTASYPVAQGLHKELHTHSPGQWLSEGGIKKLGLVSRSTGKPLTPSAARNALPVARNTEYEGAVQELRKRERDLLKQNNHLCQLWEEATTTNKALLRANKRLEKEVTNQPIDYTKVIRTVDTTIIIWRMLESI